MLQNSGRSLLCPRRRAGADGRQLARKRKVVPFHSDQRRGQGRDPGRRIQFGRSGRRAVRGDHAEDTVALVRSIGNGRPVRIAPTRPDAQGWRRQAPERGDESVTWRRQAGQCGLEKKRRASQRAATHVLDCACLNLVKALTRFSYRTRRRFLSSPRAAARPRKRGRPVRRPSSRIRAERCCGG